MRVLMQPESPVHALCAQVERGVARSEQDIDALCVQQTLDDTQYAQLSQICYGLKQLCIEATNRAQRMERFVAHNATKLADLHALYQKLGGKEPRLLHEEATALTLCATNDAIFLSPADAVPQRAKPLRADVQQQVAQERAAMQDWLAESQLMQEWPPLETQNLLACRDAIQGDEVRALALFTLDETLRSVTDTLAAMLHNLRHHQSNTIDRYMACERLVEAASRAQPAPTTMSAMFSPV